jgi:trimethylamine--corrinoid protein Co-methyltransferase
MKFTAQVLSKDEQERIHEQSLRILSEVGVRIHGEKALPILKKNGARVDEENRIARIPREMVGSFNAGKFTLGAQSGL